MELCQYVERFKAARTHRDRQALHKAVFDADNFCREQFAHKRDRGEWVASELSDPHCSLIPAFDYLELFACVEQLPEEKAVPKVFEINQFKRIPPGVQSVVSESVFRRNFDELFTEGALKYLNWEGVFAAGGSVLACLQPLPVSADRSNRDRRVYLHDRGFPSSDVDLFLVGMTAEQAKRKIVEIYDAVAEVNPFDVLCFRGTHAVTLVSQYPFRHIQIVLRLYASPLEVLAGFDVDSCAVGYDGDRVWVTPRCHLALVHQANPVNLTRRSPSYEVRLAKYAKRGFEVPIPGLQRDRIDPTLFDRPFHKVTGLAKLLLLERLPNAECRLRHKGSEILGIGVSIALKACRKRRLKHKVNRCMAERLEKTFMEKDIEVSDYSTIFLPWGKEYTAAKSAQVMITKDWLLNSAAKVKQRKYKVHPCFLGTAEAILEDCAPNDPPIPANVAAKDLEGFVRGPLAFIEDNPGRQMIGSFHPITDADYCSGAYVTEDMGTLCLAANSNDIPGIKRALAAGVSPNCNDFAGRTPLQLCAFTGSLEAAQLLLDAGARLTARMPDGRTVLHIGAIMGCTELVTMVLEKSQRNREAVGRTAGREDGCVGGGSSGAKLEGLDVFDLDAEEWNHKLSPLHIGIMLGEIKFVDVLVNNGANPNKGWQLGMAGDHDYEIVPILILVMNLCWWNPDASKKILQILIKGGCDAGWMDMSLKNILHMAAGNGNAVFLEQILEISPSLKRTALDAISLEKLTPLLTAIEQCHLECVATLIKHGARMELTDADCELTRRRSESVKSSDGCIEQQIRNAQHLSIDDIEPPLWLAVRQLEKRIREVGVVLEGFESETSEGCAQQGAASNESKKHKDPFSIVETLIANGADVNLVKPKQEGKTLTDFVAALLQPLEDAELEGKLQNAKMIQMYKREVPDCKGSVVEVDGISVLTHNGLPAEYSSPLKIRQLLDSGDVPEGSYLQPTLEAYALKFDAEFLGRWCTDIIEDDGRRKQKAYRKLLNVLERAGGLPFWQLQGLPPPCDAAAESKTNHGYAHRIPKPHQGEERNFVDEIARYSFVPPKAPSEIKTSRSRGNPTDSQTGLPIPESKQQLYHGLFEAAWRGDVAHIESATLGADPKDQLLVSVQNSHFQTPLIVAMLGGHAELAFRILEIAAMQYTPHPNVQKKKERGAVVGIEKHQDDRQLNNFAVEALMEGGDFEGNFERMKREAGALAENVANATHTVDPDSAGSSAEEGVTCHTSPEDLLNHVSYLPAALVEANLPENWRKDIKEQIRLLWKLRAHGDTKAGELLRKRFHSDDRYFTFNRTEQNGVFRVVSPMVLALFLKRRDLLDQILLACKCWDDEWAPSAKATEKSTRSKEGMDVDDGGNDLGEETAPLKDVTKLACKLVAKSTSRNLVFLLDDVELLSHLIERTGYGIPFKKILKQKKQSQSSQHASHQFSGPVTPGHPSAARCQVGRRSAAAAPALHRHTPFIITAIRCGALAIIHWLSTDSHTAIFQRFVETNEETSGSARCAQELAVLEAKKRRLGNITMVPQSNKRPNFMAFAMAYGGGLVEAFKRGLVVCALGESPPEVTLALMEEARAQHVAYLARSYVSESFTSGWMATPNALQVAAKEGRVDLFEALLDFGVSPTPDDINAARGWNILAFVLSAKSSAAALQATRILFNHRSVTHAMRDHFVVTKLGKDEITAAMVGVTMGHTEALRFLRSFAAARPKVRNALWSRQAKGGTTVLHEAARRESLRDCGLPKNWGVVKALLEWEDGGELIPKDQVASVEAQIRHAASLEDHMGLTPFDIAFNRMCKCQVRRHQRSEIKQAGLFDTRTRDNWGDIRICIAFRKANRSRKRVQPKFEDAKASAASAGGSSSRASGIHINTHAKVDNSWRVIMPPNVQRKAMYRSPGILH